MPKNAELFCNMSPANICWFGVWYMIDWAFQLTKCAQLRFNKYKQKLKIKKEKKIHFPPNATQIVTGYSLKNPVHTK